MKIAVLSGKGGTGKTFVAVNLAVAAGSGLYVDCDVEEPNGHLYFKPSNVTETEVAVPVPVILADVCTGCRGCIDFCRYHALALVGARIRVFEEICHSCGGCALLCPEKAVVERMKPVGVIQKGTSEEISVWSGVLHTGEVSGVPIIRKLLGDVSTTARETVVMDCPPGSACAVMESIKDADYCVLVAEPTVFGAHNLQMVHELAVLFQKPHGVLLNKILPGAANPSEAYCRRQGVPILGNIPYNRELAAMNADAVIAVRQSEIYRATFSTLLSSIRQGGATA